MVPLRSTHSDRSLVGSLGDYFTSSGCAWEMFILFILAFAIKTLYLPLFLRCAHSIYRVNIPVFVCSKRLVSYRICIYDKYMTVKTTMTMKKRKIFQNRNYMAYIHWWVRERENSHTNTRLHNSTGKNVVEAKTAPESSFNRLTALRVGSKRQPQTAPIQSVTRTVSC